MGNTSIKAIQHFSSLDECIQHIRTKFPPTDLIQLETAKDLDSGHVMSASVPAYLYRGESQEYPTTTSAMHRLKNDDALSLDVRTVIEERIRLLDHELQDFVDLVPMLSAGFLQHYGAPTELIDVTASIDVAALFATGHVGSKGFMCVFPVAEIANDCVIIDLTQLRVAKRPRLQVAYGFWHKEHFDLKSDAAIADLHLKWFSFTLTENDKAKYGKNCQLLDAYTDHVAGILQLLMDNLDKVCDPAARWLSDRIVPAPFVTKLIDEYSAGQPRTVELIALCKSSIDYDEEKERENNYRKWSLKYPEIRKHKLK